MNTRRVSKTTAVAVALALTWIPSSALADKKEYLALTQQISVLQGQIAESEKINRESQKEVRRLWDALADQSALLKRIQQDHKAEEERLMVLLQDSQQRLAEIAEQLRAPVRAPQVVVAPVPVQSVPTATPMSGTVDRTPPPVQPAGPVIAPRDLYQQSYGDFARKNYDLAIQGFQEYLRLYKDTEFADNAQYWIGECMQAQAKYADAIGAYNLLLRDYPASDKVPDARYKKGLALEALGRRGEAIVEYRFVVDRFPNAPAARLAREKLGL